MAHVTDRRNRDRRNLFSKIIQAMQESRRVRRTLHLAPRNLAEALRDSGALQMPAGKDRFTGGW